MDIKETQLFDRLYFKIINREFDEKDIYVFLIILRQYADKKSPVYEFANFIAHREKDRGYIKEYLNTIMYKLNNLHKINTVLEIKPVFTNEEIKISFNDLLVKVGKPKINSEILNDIVLCIIVLLQDVRLQDKKGRSFGKLVIGVSKTKVFLNGKVKNTIQGKEFYSSFPALEILNNYIELPDKYTDEEPAIFKSVIEIINNEGKFEIVFLGEYQILDEIT